MAYTATPRSANVALTSALADYHYDALDDLLYDWFCRENGYMAVEGYGRADSACGGSASSDQWDQVEEVLDRRVRSYVMPRVSEAMNEISGDHRIAIQIEQRNRMGPAVWRNPRAGDRQPEAYLEAKLAIAPILRRKGIEW